MDANPNTSNNLNNQMPNMQNCYSNSYLDVFYVNFMQKFAFSPTFSLKDQEGQLLVNNTGDKMNVGTMNYEDYLLPLDQIKQSLINKGAGEPVFPLTSSGMALVLKGKLAEGGEQGEKDPIGNEEEY